jgi:hypothetical protein
MNYCNKLTTESYLRMNLFFSLDLCHKNDSLFNFLISCFDLYSVKVSFSFIIQFTIFIRKHFFRKRYLEYNYLKHSTLNYCNYKY